MVLFGEDNSELEEGNADGKSRWASTESDAARHD
jgi:hypothetical protein